MVPKDARNSDYTESTIQELDFDGSTNFHIKPLDDHKSDSADTYSVESNSLKQIRDMLFYIQHVVKQISDTLFQSQQRQLSQADDEECRNSWMLVAMVIDRLLLLLFTLLTVFVYLVLLLNRPTYAYKHVNQPLD